MVGTTRFELATSPTPRVRSTRLSHVPTLFRLRQLSLARGVFSVHQQPLLLGGVGTHTIRKYSSKDLAFE